MKAKATIIKISLLAGLILTSLVGWSNGTPNSGTVTSETERTIRSYFKFPQVLLPHYETRTVQANRVEVLFTTDKGGKVNFVLAKTADPVLKEEIEKQFVTLQLNKVKQNVVHSVILNFRTL